MIPRSAETQVRTRLEALPAVALLGPRQVGKTTLARSIGQERNCIYLDLESPLDREKLRDAVTYLRGYANRLVVIDEVQRMPGLFESLRGLIDGREGGSQSGMYLLLGSASAELLRQSESLAGRISYVELTPLQVTEIAANEQTDLWVRGGFPRSFLAANEELSLSWRDDFIRTYLERDIPQLGPRVPAATLLRFWTMLAHLQGTLLNAAALARSLAVDGKTVARYLDLMADLMLVRRLPPYQRNVGKRLVKSPKVYVRDSGIVHALMNIAGHDALLGHPVAGGSWEGFVIDNLIAAAPPRAAGLFYRTAAGAEIDLVLEIPGHGLWAIDIKLGLAARPEKGFFIGCEDLRPSRRFIVNPGDERYPIGNDTEVIGLRLLINLLKSL